MHILIVEDEAVIRQELKVLLENSLYQVTALEDFSDVAAEALKAAVDLVLLDLSLPRESGFEICSKIRASSEIPVIFLTSRTDSMDELTGMLRGADDYITKPFSPPVLLAHITAVLKRYKRPKEVLRLEHRGVVLDLAKGYVWYQGEGAELTKNELKILHCLFLNPDRIVSRVELIEDLWDNQVFIDDNTLSVNITRIRAKLKKIGIRDFLKTKRGMGYCI